MLPISVPRGANIISRARVARLMNFIVTQRAPEDGHLALFGGLEEERVGMQAAREDDAGDFVGEEGLVEDEAFALGTVT